MIGFLPVFGRTLPPLFRTVRRVWQNSAKGSIFVWQISAEQSCGAGSGSHLDISPLFVCGFLLKCCFLASKWGARCSHSIDARPLCQTSGCSVYSTYNYLRYLSIKIRARAKRQKSLVYQRFSAFSPSVFRPFSMYKHCPHNVQVLPPMMYKDCPLNVQTLPPYNWISTAVYVFPSLMALYPFIYRSFFQ